MIEWEVFYIEVVRLTDLQTHVSGGGSFRGVAASPPRDLFNEKRSAADRRKICLMREPVPLGS